MGFEVLEREERKLKLKTKGYGHTFLNLLKSELGNDSKVTTSAYTTKHPLVPKPTLVVETKEDKPEKAIQSAIERIGERTENFRSKFKEILE